MMDRVTTQSQRMGQAPRMIPEQIIAGEILQLPRLELERHLRQEFEANPALALEEVGLCPMCEAPVARFPCPSCGHQPAAHDDVPVTYAEDWESYRQGVHDGEEIEPFASVAARRTLKDDLRGQWLAACDEASRTAGLYIIEALDDEGYLREPLAEIAELFRWSVPQVEAVLRLVQGLEPAGIAARDLRECLLIQCRLDPAPEADLAARILAECFEDVAAGRAEHIADALGVAEPDVRAALDWLRRNLSPYPARGRRDAFGRLAPREEPEVAPDAVIRLEGEDLVVEIVETARFRLAVDAGYQRTWDAMGGRAGAATPGFEHVRRSISNARWLMDAIQQRRRTLYAVMTAIAQEQRAFLLHGRAHLKPLMQKTIAARAGIHESTVCRALADKLVRIPSGETILASAFFDGSTSVKEYLAELIAKEDTARPLSDARIASLLDAAGHTIARRTVAKYREALRIPSVELRRGRV